MNKYIKILLWPLGILGGIYILFLLLPFIAIPFLDKLTSDIPSEIQKTTGFKTEFANLRLITTPKLTAGVKLENAKVYQPDDKLILNAENMKIKMSLLPLLLRRVEVDVISADKIDLNLYVKNDGHLTIEDYAVQEDDNQKCKENQDEVKTSEILPFGLKLSNKLPDIRVSAANINFNEMSSGKKHQFILLDTKITDFVFNKKIKISSNGEIYFDGHKALSYNVSVLNKIMPEMDINEFLTQPQDELQDTKTNDKNDFNIVSAFNIIKNNGIRADLNSKIKIEGTPEDVHLYGKLNLDKIAMLVNGTSLPESNVAIKFNKNDYDIDSALYTAQSENTKVSGKIKTGKNPNIDLNCKSNATLKSLFAIANTFAKIAGIKDLETLSAQGQLDVNFNIKSDMKKIKSDGYLKLANGFISYGLYGVKIENLISDIKLDNNNLLINKLGFSSMGIPLNITGKILQDATCDINVNTASLPIKGLLISLGQASVLKENPISSGTVSVVAKVTGKLTNPLVAGNVDINNLNLKNIPSDIALSVSPINIKLNTTKSGFAGTVKSGDLKLTNPALKVIAYSPSATVSEKAIVISDTRTAIEKNEVTLSGSVSDYMSDKIGLNFNTKGQINSNLSGHINPYKMTLDLKYVIPSLSAIIVPGFDKSKLNTTGSVNISGSMSNPILKGQFSVPSLEIPEVPVTMTNANASLSGPILNGNATVASFKSGGIVASDIRTDYKMKGSDFYLNNLTGSAFDGKFNGDIIYNMSTTKCDVKFKGSNMNALKAIEGAAGIKNALTGTLAFNADVNFKGADYNDMMRTLKGTTDFEIKKGNLMNLGSLDKFLFAQNLTKNLVLKAAGQSASSSSSVKNASQFEYIKGKLSFANAYANLQPVTLSGSSMAYYITGTYNLLNGSANVVVLGRLSKGVVSSLGNLGSLAVSKVSKSIPALGVLTSSVVKSMNESPKNVDISKIPNLTPVTADYKDFKVVFSGGIESTSSVKSFKWINDVDTSELDASSISETADAVKNQLNQAKSTVQSAVQNIKGTSKEEIKQQAKEQGKALLKSLLTNP